jgi:hypothetical protein
VNQDLGDQALLSAYEKEIKKLRKALEEKPALGRGQYPVPLLAAAPANQQPNVGLLA